MHRLRVQVVWAAALAWAGAVHGLPHLRILPLGDSITKGSLSSSGNGYREYLRNKLLDDGGKTVDMIGTLRDGSMVDNNHEGHSGEYIEDIVTYWRDPTQAEPNVVLIHAGTNNMDKNQNINNLPGLYSDMLDGMYLTHPDMVIIVAEVIHSKMAAMNERSNAFNSKLRDMVKSRQDDGKHILIISIDISDGDLADPKHPSDRGYEKMATGWKNAISDADSRGWLKDPVKLPGSFPGGTFPEIGVGNPGGGGGGSDGPAPSGCDGNWERKETVFDDFRVWTESGTIFDEGVEDFAYDKLIFADLNSDGIDDYVLVDKDGAVRVFLNHGPGEKWISLGDISPDWKDVKGSMIRIADVNNDGAADIIVVYSDGAAKVWRNNGSGHNFFSLDSKWASGLADGGKVQFHDMDGDGYADYIIMYDGGAVKWARNTHNNGKDSGKKNWETETEIAPGVSGAAPRSARLVDLDGDGKSDYVIINSDGSVKALTNTGNLNRGEGRNWDDLGTIAPGVSGVDGKMVYFADMDGDGLADFLSVNSDGSVQWWKNEGLLGASSANVRIADLTGDGKDDIIFVNGKGKAKAWVNNGDYTFTDMGEIAPGLDEDLSSSKIEFHDVNGDGKADYLVIYGGGAVKAYLNNGNLPSGDGRIWQDPPITISPGVGEPGSKVTFADLNGDGYADYIVIYDGGAVDGFLNRKNIPQKDGGRIWDDRFTVASGVGEPGSKVRFADITGDGKDEYIIQFDGGASKAWWNTGKMSGQDKPKNYYEMGTIAGGVSPQGPVRYADLNGDGKADYLCIYDDGSIKAWINTCDWKVKPPGGIFPEDPDDEDPGDEDPGDEDPGDEPPLKFDSTCKDVDQYTDDNGGSFTPSDAYVLTDAHTRLNIWIGSEYDRDGDSMVSQYAAYWGRFNVNCRLSEDCLALIFDCDQYDLGDCTEEDEEAGKCEKAEESGSGSLILRSFYNLHRYLAAIDQAMETTAIYYSILAPIYIKRYYPPEKIDAAAVELLWLLGTILALPAAVPGAGGVFAGGVSAVYGVAGSAMARKLGGQTTTIDDAADMAQVAYDFIKGSRDVVQEIHDSLMQNGTYESEKNSITGFFRDGDMVDESEIPVLSTNEIGISESELAEFYSNWMHAKIINWAWRKRGVYILGFEMTREEWNIETDWPPDMKVWYKGHGYFLCNINTRGSGQGVNNRPSGWDKIKEKAEGNGINDEEENPDFDPSFDVQDILYSSVDNWDDYGANADPDSIIKDLKQVDDEVSPRYGAFNIPVCYVHKSWGLESFFDQLPWQNTKANSPQYKNAGWCLCAFVKDRNGERFWDVWNDDLGDDWVYECNVNSGDNSEKYPEFGPEP